MAGLCSVPPKVLVLVPPALNALGTHLDSQNTTLDVTLSQSSDAREL